MNTRLQVEHPVTEYVSGVNLVECMIRIATGEPLDLNQSDIVASGWAVEARIYAEDPARNFLPSIGRLIRYRQPTHSEQVRVDSGVYEGGEISMHYDPMIAKLIVHQDTREKALDLLAKSLDEYQISGVTTNIPFLQALVRDPLVCAGDMHTRYIEGRFPDGYDCKTETSSEVITAAMIATIAHYVNEQRSAKSGVDRLNSQRTDCNTWVAISGQEQYEFTIEEIKYGHRLTTSNGDGADVIHKWTPGQSLFYYTIADGDTRCVKILRIGISYQLDFLACSACLKYLAHWEQNSTSLCWRRKLRAFSRFLKSPMPGRLQELRVAKGQTVKIGETIAIVEAMKMENALQSNRMASLPRFWRTLATAWLPTSPYWSLQRRLNDW